MKRIDIKKFREQGFLQELNRFFLHPMGMALEVIINEETGEEKLGGVWDYRDEPGGIVFDEIDQSNISKANSVTSFWKEKVKKRLDECGWIIQPLEVE